MIGPCRRARPARASRSSAAPFACRLVIMAREPVAGRAKTRLAREVGVAQAMRFVRHGTVALLQRVGRDPRWQTALAVAPDNGVASRMWPRAMVRIGQGGGDLGARMQRLFDRAPRGPVIIIGTDVPGIRAAHIAQAFRLLGNHDAVFGPAEDGGYWLIGLRRRPRTLRPLSDVRWSSPHALADTVDNLAGRRLARAPTLADVDNASDFARYASMFGRRVLPASVPQSPR